jgi:hypothetical protein
VQWDLSTAIPHTYALYAGYSRDDVALEDMMRGGGSGKRGDWMLRSEDSEDRRVNGVLAGRGGLMARWRGFLWIR